MSGKGGDNGSSCCGVGVCGDGDDGEVSGNRDDGGLVGGSGRGDGGDACPISERVFNRDAENSILN